MGHPNQQLSADQARGAQQSSAQTLLRNGGEAPATKRRPLDWSKEIDITTLTLPHMMAMTGGHGIVIGQHFAGGGHLSGLVRRITIMPSGAIRVIIEKQATEYATTSGDFGAFVFFGNGMYAEVDSLVHEDVTEENSGPWQKPLSVGR